ncbi:MAG: F0F1 ATP synthase subunit A [Firmicutes bacterium]|nr:F0F1 ATP synthase subunit A [Bacillota bacterium]MCL5065288.1 F0F1 ATP synthase subunit A [Bacillota bacterium]
MTWHIGSIAIDGSEVIYTWIAIVIVGGGLWLAARRVTSGVPGVAQGLLESMFEFIADLAKTNFDPDKDTFLYEILVFLFCLLLATNFEGMIPAVHSATSNLNLSGGLALAVFFLIQIYGLKAHGVSYFKHFGKPFLPLLPINIIEELSKPLTLAFRLFGNILVGDIFMELIARFRPLLFVLGGFIAAFVWWGFTAFVDAIQAFIFMVLTMAYVGRAMADE